MHCQHCEFWRRGGGFIWLEPQKISGIVEIAGRKVDVVIPDVMDTLHGRHSVCIQIDDESRWGTCLHPLIQDDCCDRWLNVNTAEDLNAAGIVANCDEDRARLMTGENFGCIHFKAK